MFHFNFYIQSVTALFKISVVTNILSEVSADVTQAELFCHCKQNCIECENTTSLNSTVFPSLTVKCLLSCSGLTGTGRLSVSVCDWPRFTLSAGAAALSLAAREATQVSEVDFWCVPVLTSPLWNKEEQTHLYSLQTTNRRDWCVRSSPRRTLTVLCVCPLRGSGHWLSESICKQLKKQKTKASKQPRDYSQLNWSKTRTCESTSLTLSQQCGWKTALLSLWKTFMFIETFQSSDHMETL